MSNNNLKDCDDPPFTLISRKKGKTINKVRSYLKSTPEAYEFFDLASSLRRIESAREELISTDLYESVLSSLREALKNSNLPVIEEIVCFGLGKIGECTVARYQLALLLCLKHLYNANTFVYDPVFNVDDKSILNSYQLCLLDSNTEGKYRIKKSGGTLFYLPHCSKQLTNNLLLSNWGLHLNHCVILANSFTRLIETHTHREILQNAKYIYDSYPYVNEIAVYNSFKFRDIFNDTAVHVFPFKQLSLAPAEIWENKTEPKYSEDFEFITSK